MEKEIIRIAQALWDRGYVHVSLDAPFQWQSGKHAPIYVDFRGVLGDLPLRLRILHMLVQKIHASLPTSVSVDEDVVGAVATGGIPYGAWVSAELSLPFLYVRPHPKQYGLQRQIEGASPHNKRIILIEELVSTGASVLNCISALKEAGAREIYTFSIFSYDFPETRKRFSTERIPLYTLLTFPELLLAGWLGKNLTHLEYRQLETWYRAPDSWGRNLGSPRPF